MIRQLSNKNGALFIEYAMILAFILITGTVIFGDSGIATSIKTILAAPDNLLQNAAPGNPFVPNSIIK